MTKPAQYVRGSVVLCNFPYDSRPDQRGPKEHFCLFVHAEEFNGRRVVAVCYGTSRLDEKLLQAHAGAILSIPKDFIKVHSGRMDGHGVHFVGDRVAIVPEEWINGVFSGRLDFIRPEHRATDPIRQRLFQAYEKFEPVMRASALQCVKRWRETGDLGMHPGSSLRAA